MEALESRRTARHALDVWPDVRPALETLHGAGIRLAFLSNLGADSLTANMRRNDIAHYFDAPLSTDTAPDAPDCVVPVDSVSHPLTPADEASDDDTTT